MTHIKTIIIGAYTMSHNSILKLNFLILVLIPYGKNCLIVNIVIKTDSLLNIIVIQLFRWLKLRVMLR